MARRWVSLLVGMVVMLGGVWLLEEGAAPSAGAKVGAESFARATKQVKNISYC